MKTNDNLSEEQKAAITCIDGEVMVLAGPGSGKTFTITRRIQNMINSGINPENILVITFTKAAADEMKERFIKLMDDSFINVNFGTFHAIYYGILKEYGNRAYTIITEKEKKNYMKIVMDNLPTGFSNEIGDLPDNISEEILCEISAVKNEGLRPEDYKTNYISGEAFSYIYHEYEKIMKENNRIDFDDMVSGCYNLLLNNEEVRRKVQSKYKYILIDEFQDINLMQYKVIKTIAEPDNNLFIVGDDDQSIYGFRGSKPEIMLNFTNEYINAKTILLAVNYRSNSSIVSLASQFIANNKVRYEKEIKAHNTNTKPVIMESYSEKNLQYKNIVKKIQTLIRKDSPGSIAVIYRTNKGAIRLTALLKENNIPYAFKEKHDNPFNTPYIQDVLAILNFSAGDCTRKNFLRFMNKPVRYISRNLLQNSSVDIPGPDLRNYKH